jgi:1-aminocyclopropane-1-carboxylate deaminase
VFDIYRGDLEHPSAPGNKWHKLQYHLKEAEKRKATVIATFGGPFSNHLHAFGSTLNNLPFKAVAVVRGELHPTLTPTLIDTATCGVELWPSSRSDYRLGAASAVVKTINELYDNVYWIPEGGGGELGALGCRDWAEQIHNLDSKYDAWVVSAGTGTTAAGFLGAHNTPNLHVFSALKGAENQEKEIIEQAHQVVDVQNAKGVLNDRLFFHSDCHEGGYAKHSQALIEFITRFAEANPNIPLDPVYTCKSMFAVLSAMQEGRWPYPRTLFVHTGGLQGWRGYSEVNNPFSLL